MAQSSLSTAAVGYLVNSIKANKAGKRPGEEMTSALWNWTENVFSRDSEAMSNLKENPGDPDHQSAVGLRISNYLNSNPLAEKTLNSIIEGFKDQGETPASVTVSRIQ